MYSSFNCFTTQICSNKTKLKIFARFVLQQSALSFVNTISAPLCISVTFEDDVAYLSNRKASTKIDFFFSFGTKLYSL